MKKAYWILMLMISNLYAGDAVQLTVSDFMLAATEGNVQVVEQFLNQNSYNKTHANITDKYGNTALMWAAYNNQVSIIKKLISHGACVDYQRPSDGVSPLHCATLTDKGDDALKILLTVQAQINIMDKNGHTPLMYAAKKSSVKNLQKIALLVNHGAHLTLQKDDLVHLFTVLSKCILIEQH